MKKNTIILALIMAFSTLGLSSFGQQSSRKGDNNPAPVMVTDHLNSNRDGSGCVYLVLEDNLPWGSNAIVDILTNNGENVSVATSATFPGLDFLQYDVIIVAGDQDSAFQVAFTANFTKFVNFVLSGRTLEVHAATCGWNSPCDAIVLLPGGVSTVVQYDDYNTIVDGANPAVAGLSNPFNGSYASHGYFENLVPNTDIITAAQSNGLPTAIEYHYGPGLVIAGTQPFSYGYLNWAGKLDKCWKICSTIPASTP